MNKYWWLILSIAFVGCSKEQISVLENESGCHIGVGPEGIHHTCILSDKTSIAVLEKHNRYYACFDTNEAGGYYCGWLAKTDK